MKCPKCGYVSHDYLSACRKCSVDLLGFKAQMQLYVVQSGNIDLRSVLGGMQSSPMTSGEFSSGKDIFGSRMLVDAQAEDGFDINLDDDFNFTPSPMSLESLDGSEVARLESTTPESQRPAATDRSGLDLPDTGYATVMMDISGLSDEGPPLKPAGDKFDAPLELAGPELDAPVESAEAIIAPPDLISAALRSSVGRTSDLDLTSMELRRTTRDIEMLNQLQNKAPSGDTTLPGFDDPAVIEEVTWSSSDASEPIMGDLDHSDLEEMAADDAASLFSPTLPASFPEEVEGTDDLNEESGELILPSFDTHFLAGDATGEATSSAGSASDDSDTSFTMPDLPDLDADERPINAFTEAFSLDIDPLAPPDPLPMDFPDLQTNTSPGTAPEEVTLIDEAGVSETAPPVTEDDATRSPVTDDATIELDVSGVHPLEASVFPDLPADTDALLTQSPEEATLADTPSPFAPTGYITVDLSGTLPETTQADAGEPETPEIDDELDLELLDPDEQPPK